MGVSYRGRLWDLEVNTADNSITINFPLRENYSDFRAKWDQAKTRDERETLVQKWRETKENIQHRAYTFDTPIFEYVFFTNKAGKRIRAIGAVLLDGLVRLGVRKKMTKEEDDTDPYLHDMATSSDQAFGAKQSTLFQIEVYGKAVVDEARVKLDKVYDTIRTTTPRNSPWRNAP